MQVKEEGGGIGYFIKEVSNQWQSRRCAGLYR